jgi:hypothetical protein
MSEHDPKKKKPMRTSRKHFENAKRELSQWKLVLHNRKFPGFSVEGAAIDISAITHITVPEARLLLNEAEAHDEVLILITHKEHAELLKEQFNERQLAVTMHKLGA